MEHLIGYAALCVLVPGAWGLLVYWVGNALGDKLSRRQADETDESHLPPDYHI